MSLVRVLRMSGQIWRVINEISVFYHSLWSKLITLNVPYAG